MSGREQHALLAFFRSFDLSQAIASFEALSDGRVLSQVLEVIDAVHFTDKILRSLDGSFAEGSSSSSWVTDMNMLFVQFSLLMG